MANSPAIYCMQQKLSRGMGCWPGSGLSTPLQTENWMALVMTKNQEMNKSLIFFEKEMIGKCRQRCPAQTVVNIVKQLWIACHLRNHGFYLHKKSISEFAATFRIVKCQGRPQVALYLLVEDYPHGLPAQVPADFIPRTTDGRIIRKFARPTPGFGDSIVHIYQHPRQ